MLWLPEQSAKKLRILDFDIECRPLSWYGGDWVTKEVTAIGAAWVGKNGKPTGPVQTWLLNPFERMSLKHRNVEEMMADFEQASIASTIAMLEGFRAMLLEADCSTGHYIRGFDLPVLNGAMLEFGLKPLDDVMTLDTKGDLIKAQGLSKSMENLGSTFELKHPKVIMNQAKWRSANRLFPAGIEDTRKRVVGDVREHIEMRYVMLERGVLRQPSMWSGTGTGSTPSYSA